MARVSPLMVLPPVIFAAFAAMAWFGMQRSGDGRELPSTRIGQPAPPVTEEALPGHAALKAEDLRTGDVTLVNFWATWCPPCRAEHPRLLEMQAEGLRIAGVNVRDDVGKAQRYLAEDGNPFFAVPFDPSGRTAIDWGVTGQPETFIIDGDGTVLFRFSGPLIGSDYEQRFLPALQDALAGE